MKRIALCTAAVFLLLLCINCSSRGRTASRISDVPAPTVTVEKADDIANWHLDANTTKTNFIKDYIGSIEAVPLETNDSCLIGAITYLAFVNDTIVVVDAMKSQSIYLFDRNGSFIRKLSSKGQGPMEYSAINNITVHGDTIDLLDWLQQQLLSYRLNSGQVKRFDMSRSRPQTIAYINDSLFIGAYSSSDVTRDKYALTWINGSDSIIGTARPFRYTREIVSGEFNYSPSGELLYYRTDCDTIFKVTPNTVEPVYTLGLGGDIYDFVEETIDLPYIDFVHKWFDDEQSPFSYYDLRDFGDDWIVSFRQGSKAFVSVINKATNKSKTYIHTDLVNRHLYIPFLLYTGNKEEMLSYIDGTFRNELNREERQRLYDAYPFLENMIEHYDFESQNPVVCILKKQ